MKQIYILLLVIVVITLLGCADTVDTSCIGLEPVGFWHGLWHGWISPFALIGHIFSDSIAVYARYNNGGWYDFGFLIGVGAFSSSTTSIKKQRG